MTSTRELRTFGWIVGGVAALLAILGKHRIVWGEVSASLILLAFFAPRALEVPRRLWLKAGEVLGWINSRVLLTILFFLVITPVGWIRRIFGKPGLQLAFDRSLLTYAEPSKKRESDHFKFQF